VSHQQLELDFMPPATEEFLCDRWIPALRRTCDARGEAPAGSIPPGWIVAGRAIACSRGARGRRCEPLELHYCGSCAREERAP
jgi:hypothetical protein